MKKAWFKAFLIVTLALVVAFIIYYFQGVVNLANLGSAGGANTWMKDPPIALLMTVVGSLAVALLVFLILDRWRRIEGEMLSLRQAQEKSLDELQKRADNKVSEKMETVIRQAQAIRDRTANLLEQHPWIKGITDADFTPDSCSCQIVLRNASKFVTQGQQHLAHEYLFNWTRSKDKGIRLEGAAYDFLELARFSRYVLADEYLAMLMLAQGYVTASQRRYISPAYLKALARFGMMQEATDLAHSMRRYVFPSWLQKIWVRVYLSKKPIPKPLVEEYAALAIYDSLIGDQVSFVKDIQKAKECLNKKFVKKSQKDLVILNEIEGNIMLGHENVPLEALNEFTDNLDPYSPLINEILWALRSGGLVEKSDSILRSTTVAIQKDLFQHARTEPSVDAENTVDRGNTNTADSFRTPYDIDKTNHQEPTIAQDHVESSPKVPMPDDKVSRAVDAQPQVQ